VGVAVMNALHDCPDVESITVSGPGDPTLHPGFGAALGDVLSARRVREELPVRIVTNAYRLLDPRIRRLVGFADERIVRIDAGGGRIARPAQEASVHALRAALEALDDFSIESVFVEGPDGNANSTDIDAWLDLVASLSPTRVYVTTVAGRPVEPGTRRAGPGVLESIAARLHARTGRLVSVIA
jgi:wyosine [tRNA(Phe)-imidazoG37] synthetase (radical SAM superfamily)